MKITLPAILAISIVVGSFFYLRNNLQLNQPAPTAPPSAISTRIFQSSNVLDLTVNIPTGFEAREDSGIVTITSDKGKIIVIRNSTNFSNLQDYLDDLSKKNKLNLSNKKNTDINGVEAIVVESNNDKTYFIYVPNRVYSISTGTKELFNGLDQIARSFRYTPD